MLIKLGNLFIFRDWGSSSAGIVLAVQACMPEFDSQHTPKKQAVVQVFIAPGLLIKQDCVGPLAR